MRLERTVIVLGAEEGTNSECSVNHTKDRFEAMRTNGPISSKSSVLFESADSTQSVITRKKTNEIFLGDVGIGGNHKISIQTMTNTNTEDVSETLDQVKKAESAGADIVRISIPTIGASTALKYIAKSAQIPIVADIHFDHRIAIEAIKNGAKCVRINPGNINQSGIKEIVKCALDFECAIRIGVNSGSLSQDIMDEFSGPNARAIAESAIRSLAFIEDLGFFNMKISVKSSDVKTMIDAYREVSRRTRYPLHLGVTEAGTLFRSTIKSSIGIGALLADGIGDTIRVSVSGGIEEEIKIGKQILASLGIQGNSVDIVSCPTCSRTCINVVEIANSLEKLVEHFDKKLKISVLGCTVNGIGEAKHSDIGIFGISNGFAKIYLRGNEYAQCKASEILKTVELLLREL
jgi:(E)-4-hydroxy-3-methylbut-2-enyl-diphosphate synthase